MPIKHIAHWFTLSTFILIALFTSGYSHANQANNVTFLSKAAIQSLNTSVYEVVTPKQEDEQLVYARELPFEKLTFLERNEKYFSIGTAFFINEKQLMSAAHVFSLETFSFYNQDLYIRDANGAVYPIKQIYQYSNTRDMVIFDLHRYPASRQPLVISTETDIGDTVFSVGNAQGEGISFRAGQIASFTTEPIYGKWKNIRFTAPASPGNSGGPLVNVDGEVVGLIIQKNASENHNVAVPIEQMEQLDGKARFEQRNVSSFLNDPQNSLSKTWNAVLPLPLQITTLAEQAQTSISSFYRQSSTEIFQKYADVYLPKNTRFRSYLRNQQYVNLFGYIYSDADFRKWSLRTFRTEDTQLDDGRTLSIGSSLIADYQVLVEKPNDTPLAQFLDNPALVMDSMLHGLNISRHVAGEKIRITSMGEPESSQQWRDELGRRWRTSLWHLRWGDAVLFSHCLPHPGGAICLVDQQRASVLSESYLASQQKDMREIVIGYSGSVEEWVDYFSLDATYHPTSMADTQFTFTPADELLIKLTRYSIAYTGEDIDKDSTVHLHFGYSNTSELAEDLLLFELFLEGSSTNHYRVQKYFSPTEFNTDEYQSTWDDLSTGSNFFSSGIKERNGNHSIQKVMPATRQELQPELTRIFVIRCIREDESEGMKQRCDNFADQVTFHTE